MNDALPNFYFLEDALVRVDADYSAAEVHGIYCAVLSIDHNRRADELIQQIVQGDRLDYHFQAVEKNLQSLHKATLSALNNEDLVMTLLLQDEDNELYDRLSALQKWCQGFALGLALSGLSSMEKLPDDSREWVEDVIKIGASGEFDLDDEEGAAEALEELTEFLRVGVLMVNEEMQPQQGLPDM